MRLRREAEGLPVIVIGGMKLYPAVEVRQWIFSHLRPHQPVRRGRLTRAARERRQVKPQAASLVPSRGRAAMRTGARSEAEAAAAPLAAAPTRAATAECLRKCDRPRARADQRCGGAGFARQRFRKFPVMASPGKSPPYPGSDLVAARMETTAGRWVKRAWHVAMKQRAGAPRFDTAIGYRRRGDEGLRIRVKRIVIEAVLGRDLNDLAEIHDRDR